MNRKFIIKCISTCTNISQHTRVNIKGGVKSQVQMEDLEAPQVLGLSSQSEIIHLRRKRKFHCTTDLLFDWFAFDQTNKSVSNSTKAESKEIKPVVSCLLTLPIMRERDYLGSMALLGVNQVTDKVCRNIITSTQLVTCVITVTYSNVQLEFSMLPLLPFEVLSISFKSSKDPPFDQSPLLPSVSLLCSVINSI